MSQFVLQAKNPRPLRSHDEEDQSLLDAIQTVFPLDTEDASMVWGSIRVSFNYKYTISYLLPDILGILDRLMREDSGSLTNCFPTQEFPAIWHLRWEGNKLTLRSEWNTPPGSQALREVFPTLNLEKDAFIAEWKQILGIVLNALVEAGYQDRQLADMPKLRAIHAAIHAPGVLCR